MKKLIAVTAIVLTGKVDTRVAATMDIFFPETTALAKVRVSLMLIY